MHIIKIYSQYGAYYADSCWIPFSPVSPRRRMKTQHSCLFSQLAQAFIPVLLTLLQFLTFSRTDNENKTITFNVNTYFRRLKNCERTVVTTTTRHTSRPLLFSERTVIVLLLFSMSDLNELHKALNDFFQTWMNGLSSSNVASWKV